MARKKLYLNALSVSSIQKLKKSLLDYQDSIEDKLVLFCQRLSEVGIEIAQANIVSLDAVFTGELFNSFYYEPKLVSKDKVVFVMANGSEHAIYVEMGTGLIGAENPYIGNLPAVYAQGKHIRKTADGKYYWFYYRDGQWYYTEGMPSRPFMWLASTEMQYKVAKIAREVFGNV